MINITIDGKKIQCEPNKTIYEIAKENNIEIPKICDADFIQEGVSCDICLVNIVGNEGLSDASTTVAKDGMKIFTDSRSVNRARKISLELLLSDHYANCEAPCKTACPLNLDIQTLLSHISDDETDSALKIISQTLPLPYTISKLCPGYCENQCYRSFVDESIKIKEIVNYLSDKLANIREPIDKIKKNGKKIAIVGAGISGLICGFELSKKGYDVQIFESMPEAGGKLRYYLPEFIIPKDILKKEIENLQIYGMKIKTNTSLGKDISLNKLSSQYDAVYLATGLQKKNIPKLKNLGKTKSVIYANDFLTDYHLGKKTKLGKDVTIYGNNDTALYCARIIKRIDANLNVSIYTNHYSETDMFDNEKLTVAKSENINVIKNKRPIHIKKEKGKKFSLLLKNLTDDTTEIKKTDTFILAFEPKAEIGLFHGKLKKISLPLNSDKKLRVSISSHYTGIKNIFAGGNLILERTRSISHIILDAQKAASSIDNYLSNNKPQNIAYHFNSYKETDISQMDKNLFLNYKKQKHIPKKIISYPKSKSKIPIETEIKLVDDDIKNEAKLCLNCGCLIQSTCNLKKYAEKYKAEPQNYTGKRNKYPIDESHPFITFDPNKCIKCGLCIEVCQDIAGKSIFGFIDKGFGTYIAPELGLPLKETDCLSCGKCTEICPTAALYPKNINYTLNSLTYEETYQNCGLCGLGCEIKVKSQSGKVKIISPSGNGINKNNLCFEGKFAWQIFESDKRIKKPYIRVDKTNDWQEKKPIWIEEENLAKISKIIKNQLSASQKNAIYVDPVASLEETLMLKEIADKLNANLYSFTSDKTFMNSFYNTIYTEKNFNDLYLAKSIVIIGNIPLVLRSVIRELQKKGKKLIIITEEKNKFNHFADILLDSSNINLTLEKIIEYNNLDCSCSDVNCDCNTEQILQVDLPPKTVFVYNKHRVSEQVIANILRLSYQICSEYTPGSGLFEVSDFINTKAFIKMKIPKYSLQLADTVFLYGTMPNSEQLKWLEKSKFVISFDTHLEDDCIADIFIPKPDYLSIDAKAIADDLRVVNFKNVKKENYFENILTIFKNAGLLTKKQSSPEYWNKKADEFIKSLPKPVSFDENRLAELIESIDNVKEKVLRYYPVYYFEINKLKKYIK
jgi:formate dehydrogenase major subunit